MLPQLMPGSRKIVGQNCVQSLEAHGWFEALKAHSIHCSERGSQYCGPEYVNRLPVLNSHNRLVARAALFGYRSLKFISN